jgi:hypothetical protein
MGCSIIASSLRGQHGASWRLAVVRVHLAPGDVGTYKPIQSCIHGMESTQRLAVRPGRVAIGVGVLSHLGQMITRNA